MRPEPSLSEKISAITDEGELTGFEGQLQIDGRLDDRAKNLLAMRRADIRKMKGWK